jgi:hypothetical protein
MVSLQTTHRVRRCPIGIWLLLPLAAAVPVLLWHRCKAHETRAGNAFHAEMKILHRLIKPVAICSPELFLANVVDR